MQGAQGALTGTQRVRVAHTHTAGYATYLIEATRGGAPALPTAVGARMVRGG